MKGVKNAPFICGWARQEQEMHIVQHGMIPNATSLLFTLPEDILEPLLPHLISGNVRTKHFGAELGGAEPGAVPCTVRSRT
jgi:hypothetical protein